MTKIFTAADARNEKNAWNAKFFAKQDKADKAEAEIKAILANNPQIGRLNGNKFYIIKAGKEIRANHPSKLVGE